MDKANSRLNNRTIYILLLLICIIGFWLFENFYTPDTYSDAVDHVGQTELSPDFLPSSSSGMVVEHDHYMLSYSEPHEQAEWVAYSLKKEHLTQDRRKRPFFLEDPKVPSKSADWRNYRGSGYDRGHLCPAGDRKFSEQAYNETFYTSNISPQNSKFNAGVWNRLEIQNREWAKKHNELFVVAGGVLESGLDEIGEEDVDVPRYFYKIIAIGDNTNLKILGFLLLARESKKPLQEFVVSVDEIEERTGIDFFEKLSDSLEVKLEREVDLAGWDF
ncbi:MAG: DNA/RNA non-specific endonuclease [Pricia sp.]|nr:DNA/RNA non-specific endonuclease [Pricia sp.]